MASNHKILVVGEAPSRWMEERGIVDALPLAGKELARMAGIRWPDQWFEMFEPVNVLDRWPGRGPNGKNNLFPLAEGIAAAGKLQLGWRGRRVILLGRRVARCFHIELPWFDWGCHPWLGSVAVAPHPSHPSRWWNDPLNRAAAGRFWMSVVEGQGVR